MILDTTLQLASAYAPTAVATNTNGTYIDTVVTQDWGMGETILWYVRINATATTGGAATLQFLLQGATDAAFTTPVLMEEAPYTATLAANFATQAIAGTEYKVPLRRGNAYRYIRFAVAIGGAVLTAGSFDSWLTNRTDAQDNRPNAGNYSVK